MKKIILFGIVLLLLTISVLGITVGVGIRNVDIVDVFNPWTKTRDYITSNNQTNKNWTFANITSINIKVSGTINATRLNGSLDCSNIVGGSDSNYCVDADIGGNAITNSSPANFTNINVNSINNTDLALFNKSISLIDYLTSISSFFNTFWTRANTTDQIGDNASILRTINISNIRESLYQLSNFTSNYDARTDRFGRSNVSDYLGGADINASLIKSTNTSANLKFAGINITGGVGTLNITLGNGTIYWNGSHICIMSC